MNMMAEINIVKGRGGKYLLKAIALTKNLKCIVHFVNKASESCHVFSKMQLCIIVKFTLTLFALTVICHLQPVLPYIS